MRCGRWGSGNPICPQRCWVSEMEYSRTHALRQVTRLLVCRRGTAVCAIHATACKACVARVSRNCQIKTDAKCMRSSNAVKAMAARQFRVQKRTKEGSNPQGMSLTKRLEAETATRPKIQPRLKHRGKDKPLAQLPQGVRVTKKNHKGCSARTPTAFPKATLDSFFGATVASSFVGWRPWFATVYLNVASGPAAPQLFQFGLKRLPRTSRPAFSASTKKVLWFDGTTREAV